jgi:hypothetical protein
MADWKPPAKDKVEWTPPAADKVDSPVVAPNGPAEPDWFMPGSKSEAVVRGFSNAATLGLAPKIANVVSKVTGANWDDQVKADKKAAEDNFWSYMGGNVLGAVPQGLAAARTALAAGPGLARQALGGGTVGAGFGAASGAGNSDSLAEVPKNAAMGGAMGGAMGAAAVPIPALAQWLGTGAKTLMKTGFPATAPKVPTPKAPVVSPYDEIRLDMDAAAPVSTPTPTPVQPTAAGPDVMGFAPAPVRTAPLSDVPPVVSTKTGAPPSKPPAKTPVTGGGGNDGNLPPNTPPATPGPTPEPTPKPIPTDATPKTADVSDVIAQVITNPLISGAAGIGAGQMGWMPSSGMFTGTDPYSAALRTGEDALKGVVAGQALKFGRGAVNNIAGGVADRTAKLVSTGSTTPGEGLVTNKGQDLFGRLGQWMAADPKAAQKAAMDATTSTSGRASTKSGMKDDGDNGGIVASGPDSTPPSGGGTDIKSPITDMLDENMRKAGLDPVASEPTPTTSGELFAKLLRDQAKTTSGAEKKALEKKFFEDYDALQKKNNVTAAEPTATIKWKEGDSGNTPMRMSDVGKTSDGYASATPAEQAEMDLAAKKWKQQPFEQLQKNIDDARMKGTGWANEVEKAGWEMDDYYTKVLQDRRKGYSDILSGANKDEEAKLIHKKLGIRGPSAKQIAEINELPYGQLEDAAREFSRRMQTESPSNHRQILSEVINHAKKNPNLDRSEMSADLISHEKQLKRKQ